MRHEIADGYSVAYLLIDYLPPRRSGCSVATAGDHTKFDEGVRNEIEAHLTTLIGTDDALSITSQLEEFG